MKTPTEKHMREYDRLLLRSAVASLIRAIIGERRRSSDGGLPNLAKALKRDKGQVSRWLSSEPNWRLDSLSDVATALDVELEVRAHDRRSGQIITASGVQVREAERAWSADKPLHLSQTPTMGAHGADLTPQVQVALP